jgi:8-oxo-dGTP pyrophosphatase MutT (NUDIX family)
MKVNRCAGTYVRTLKTIFVVILIFEHPTILANLRSCAPARIHMHTVFINDTPLRFINAYNKSEIESAEGHLILSETDQPVEDLILEIEHTKNHPETFYLAEDADAAWKIFISYYQLVEAAGGLVQNRKGEFLVIFRHDKWDLPKGKLDYDESPEQAAIREVMEECGIDGLSIVKKLPLTFHTYTLKEKRKLKKNHWFLMQTESDVPLIPQVEEDIREARWMDKSSVKKKVLADTYASIAELLNNFFRNP